MPVTYGPLPLPPPQHTCIGALRDDLPDLTEEDVHLWTHGDDEEDEATVRVVLDAEEYAEDPSEAIKRRLHCGGAYVEEIIDN